MPTEAEWEYAARSGGNRDLWAGTNNNAQIGVYAWFEENSQAHTLPVDKKIPNELGIRFKWECT